MRSGGRELVNVRNGRGDYVKIIVMYGATAVCYFLKVECGIRRRIFY